MAFTLSKMLQRAYRKLGQMEQYLATGGSTSTVISTNLRDIYNDDDLTGGAIFILRDAGGAGAAPEGEYQRIASYVQSTNTITMDTNFTVAPASGDTFGMVKSVYPIDIMVSLACDALSGLGSFPLVDTTTLTSSTATEYTQAVAWKYKNPIRIDLQTDLTTSDNQWETLRDWEVQPAAPGSTGLLIFPNYLPTSYKLRVWYEVEHPEVLTYAAVVSEYVHPALAVAALAEKAMEWQNNRTKGTDSYMLQEWNNLKMEVEALKREFPITKPKRTAKVLALGEGVTRIDDWQGRYYGRR